MSTSSAQRRARRGEPGVESTHPAVSSGIRFLEGSQYPGRGIILGMTPDARSFAQVYWIMGRSPNSKNRVFVRSGDSVLAEPHVPEKVTDPSLILYRPVAVWKRCHVVSNGDQTETVVDTLAAGGTFETALATRRFEPDAPHYTPRISGIVNLDDPTVAYKLSILKTLDGDPGVCLRHVYGYDRPLPGHGHLITTYSDEGDPIPSFAGEPLLVPIADTIEATADRYWHLLHDERRVSLLVKFIAVETGDVETVIINRNAAPAT